MPPHAKRRRTPQRDAVLTALRASCEHPTATELYEALRRDLPRISLGTVYRNLDVLLAEGLVRRLGRPGGEARWDADQAVHDHARCRACGAIADVPRAEAAALPSEVAGFAIEERRLEYVGLCPDCRAGGRRG
jgi:Fur family ferric uptake transcriptional regulator